MRDSSPERLIDLKKRVSDQNSIMGGFRDLLISIFLSVYVGCSEVSEEETWPFSSPRARTRKGGGAAHVAGGWCSSGFHCTGCSTADDDGPLTHTCPLTSDYVVGGSTHSHTRTALPAATSAAPALLGAECLCLFHSSLEFWTQRFASAPKRQRHSKSAQCKVN